MNTFVVAHQVPGRMRLRIDRSLSAEMAEAIRWVMIREKMVDDVKVILRTSDIIITYHGDDDAVLKVFEGIDLDDAELLEKAPDSGIALNAQYWDEMMSTILDRVFRRILFPVSIRNILSVISSLPYIAKGIKTLFTKGLKVEVLDASALTAALLTHDYGTAGSVSFLLKIGEILEEWTYKKSVSDLANAMALNVHEVWREDADGNVESVSIDEVTAGEKLHVAMGTAIPLDGTVVSGEGMVNQAALTGESVPVRKKEGSTVYAGTVIEEGNLVIEVKNAVGQTRYEKITHMIEDSQKLKSDMQGKAETLADKLVPYTFGAAVLTGLLTRNVTKAVSVLMVDFSCALKLSTPIAVLSAMREAQNYHITVKGGSFIEKIAYADTLVFDKTGTLTKATPTVKKVAAVNGYNEEDMLRLSACLEEHFPHSMANAVVRAAQERGLKHDEMHSKVEYIVAHGIASAVNGKRVVIGSAHFVLEDEHIEVSDEARDVLDGLPKHYSKLYLGIDGKLAAIICIEDPLKEEVPEVIAELKKLGVKNLVMMTGDSRSTAEAIAEKAGLTEVHAEVLPEDKANYVKQAKENGHTVMMVGDGINDSPALSEADVGIAIAEGADIAREVADVTISQDDLHQLIVLRKLSTGLMKRLKHDHVFIIAFNSSIILGGIFGIFAPGLAAILHNSSTVAICLYNMKHVLKEEQVKTIEAPKALPEAVAAA